MLEAQEIHHLVSARSAEIRERVTAALLELEDEYGINKRTKLARLAVKRKFPGIVLPKAKEPESFAPPDLFADISVEDIKVTSLERIDERIRAVSLAMNTPEGRKDPALMSELVSLQKQKNALQ
jgi:hypothetical protein